MDSSVDSRVGRLLCRWRVFCSMSFAFNAFYKILEFCQIILQDVCLAFLEVRAVCYSRSIYSLNTKHESQKQISIPYIACWENDTDISFPLENGQLRKAQGRAAHN